jgi:hypothetical protein
LLSEIGSRPHHLTTLVQTPRDLDTRNADGAQHESTILVTGHDMYGGGEIESRNVMHSIFFRAVSTGVGNGPTTHVNNAVSALFDTFTVGVGIVAGLDYDASSFDVNGSPQSPKIGSTRYQFVIAPTQHRRGEGVPKSARGRGGDWDLIAVCH